MEVSVAVAATFIGLELHGACAGAVLAFDAFFLYLYGAVFFGKGSDAGRYPRRQGAHRTKGAPGARGIYEREHDAYDGGDHDDGPEYPPGRGPVAPGMIHLHAEHSENEQDHESAEGFGAHESGYGPVWRVLGQEPVVHVSSGAGVAAPPAAPADGEGYGRHHTYKGYQADDGIEVSGDEIGE